MYEYVCCSVMATRMHTACNLLPGTQWHLHGMPCSASRFNVWERPSQIQPPVGNLQVTSRKRAYKLNSTDLLHAYLLRLAADMHQTANVPSAAPVEGNRHAGLSLGKFLLAAAAVAVARQVSKQLTATFKVASASAARQSTITVHTIRGNTSLAHWCSSTSCSQVMCQQ